MGYEDRLEIYREIEKVRERPLLVYMTSSRHHASAAMATDAVPPFLDQMEELSNGTDKEIDFLIASNGGDPTVAWRLMSLLRERFNTVTALIPQAAFSAATLLALGADEILMHPNANLGPVDPQITKPAGKSGDGVQFGHEDFMSFLELAEESGLSDEAKANLFMEFCRETGPLAVGVSARSSKLSLAMSQQMLMMHMEDETLAHTIAEKLTKNYFHHGYPVSRSEAKEIGLNVADTNGVEDLIWKIWIDVESEFKMRIPFDPLQEYLRAEPSSKLLSPAQHVSFPQGIPQAAYPQIVQAILSSNPIAIDNLPLVDFSLDLALVESAKFASRCRAIGKIMATRDEKMKIDVNAIVLENSWRRL